MQPRLTLRIDELLGGAHRVWSARRLSSAAALGEAGKAVLLPPAVIRDLCVVRALLFFRAAMPPSSRRQFEAIVRHSGLPLARCLLRRGQYVIGQDRRNEIALEEASVSGQHARLTVVSESEIYVEDLGSSNGTFVNGEPAHGLTPVALSDAIELGECTLEFQRGGLPASVFDHLPAGFLRAGRYNFGELVVQGSTSVIYEAHDTSLDRAVAIKVMLPESQAAAAQVLRFVREAQITSQLQHPNIPPIYELSVDEGSRLFYTTRFVEGETLADILDALLAGNRATADRWNLANLLTVFQKTCDAVAFAHSRGVVHCALQAERVMVGAFGEVFVTGWGLAKVGATADSRSRSAPPCVRAPETDTIPSLSAATTPEQATGSLGSLEARTDIYALGAVLYRILALQDPVSGADETELLGQILTGLIPNPATRQRSPLPHCPGGRIPEHLAAVVIRALSSESNERHSEVSELQREVGAWQEGLLQGADATGIWKGVAGLLGRKA